MRDGLSQVAGAITRPGPGVAGQGRTFLCTGLDGFMSDAGSQGLLVFETQLLSRYRYLIDGSPPIPVGLSNVEQYSWMGYYIAPPPGDRRADPSQQTIELRVSRNVGGGLHEDLDLTNFTGKPADLDLEIEADADFADLGERRPRARGRRGRQAGCSSSTACPSSSAAIPGPPTIRSRPSTGGPTHPRRGPRPVSSARSRPSWASTPTRRWAC